MAYVYRHFIPQNIAPKGAKNIRVYKGEKKICAIPLGGLTPKTETPLYSFGLISDLHVYKSLTSWDGNTKFDNALTFFESKGCSFCAHCGDITQTGLYDEGNSATLAPAQFEAYKSICDKHTIPVYGLCGNHESYVNPITNNLDELKYYTGTDLYYTIAQGNDLFIFIGQPNPGAVMSDEAFEWLSEILEANKDKRCFVFVHAYIEEDSGDPLDYRENSIFEYWGTAKTTNFMNLLRNYQNVVLFHGHSHTKYEMQALDKSANYTEKNGFKSVHVPSSGVPRDCDTSAGATINDNAASQGYVIDVYEDCVVLNGYDLINKKIIPLGTFKINVAEG